MRANFVDGSTDSDGTVTGWSWAFGDGTTSTAQDPSHTYAASGTYTVTLAATDNGGATGSVSHPVTVTAPASSIVLTAKGTTSLFGQHRVNLTWTGATGSVKVFRNSTAIATTSATKYTDNGIGKAIGTFTYQVCLVNTPNTCSNTASVTF